ncbi:MAG: hypothetical protein R6W87_06520 [Halospina sp.]
MRTVRILEEASQEAEEAAAWYESEQPGLGAEFFTAIDRALDILEENYLPLSPLPDEAGKSGAKRLVLDRFPYDLVAIEMKTAGGCKNKCDKGGGQYGSFSHSSTNPLSVRVPEAT